MMTVRLIAHTPEPEKVVAAAAKLCYSDAHITDLLDGLTEEKTAKFLTMLSDLGHASPIEHASFTFGIEGVSRTLLARSPGTASHPSVSRASGMSGWTTSTMSSRRRSRPSLRQRQPFLRAWMKMRSATWTLQKSWRTATLPA